MTHTVPSIITKRKSHFYRCRSGSSRRRKTEYHNPLSQRVKSTDQHQNVNRHAERRHYLERTTYGPTKTYAAVENNTNNKTLSNISSSSSSSSSLLSLSSVLCYSLLFCCLYVGADSCYVYPPDVKDPCAEKRCSFGASCVPSLDGLAARCVCPQQCNTYGDSVGSKPVCGDDGNDYANECQMRQAACNQMKDITIKYTGPCGKYHILLSIYLFIFFIYLFI